MKRPVCGAALFLMVLAAPVAAFAAESTLVSGLMSQIERNIFASSDAVSCVGIALLGAAMLLTSLCLRPQKHKKRGGGGKTV